MKKKTVLKVIFTPFFAILLAALAVGNGVALYYFDTITEFFHGSSTVFEGEKVEQALENGDKLNVQIEEEGIVMFRNEDMNRHNEYTSVVNNALPMTSEELEKVNVFGWSATDRGWVAGSDGSCNANNGANKNKYDSILDAFDNAKIGDEEKPILYNQELIDMYEEFRVGRAERRGLTGHDQFFMLIEPNRASYDAIGLNNQTLLQNAIDFSDVAIVVISRLGGENNDLPYFQLKNTTGKYTDSDTLPRDDTRTYLDLSTEEEDMLRMVRDNFRKVIVIYNGCNNMNLEYLERFDVDACISVNGTGQSGVDAIPKILSGEVNPSGKSVQIQPYDLTTDPTYLNCGKRTRAANTAVYAENIYVGYKYYETADVEGVFDNVDNEFGKGYEGVIQYPFGYGLSYTTFDWDIVECSPAALSKITEDTQISVKVDVTNTGNVSGKDIVELYVTPPYYDKEIEKSHVNLMAFAKTSELKPGQTERLTLTFDAYDMASYDCYDSNHNRYYGYELDRGTYEVKLMRDSHTLNSNDSVIKYSVDKTIKFREDPVTGNKVENRFTNYTLVKKQDDGSFTSEVIKAYANCALDGSDSTKNPITYLSRTNFVETFPNKTYGAMAGDAVTNAYSYVPDVQTDGNPVITGVEANLRLVTKEDGSYFSKAELQSGLKNAKVNEELMLKLGADYDDPTWDTLLNQMSKDEINTLVCDGNYYNREVASIGKPKLLDSDGPSGLNRHVAGIGTGDKSNWTMYSMPAVIAQSWNVHLSYSFGLSVGAESLATGNNGWYAPGANMMRSPFCGRNSEYYSEDSVLSGYMASESCRGAIANGMNVYLKHFALNETESGRINLPTWCTEQTLREIYLRPYEIAVKKGGCNGFMTSLNRIGNVPASHCKALVTDIARDEWGFRGSVVTDSYIGSKDIPSTAVKAGVNLMLGVATSHNVTNDETTLYYARLSCKNIIYAWARSWYTSKTHDHSQDIISSDVGVFVQGEKPTPYWWYGVIALDGAMAVTAGVSLFFIWKKKKIKGGIK